MMSWSLKVNRAMKTPKEIFTVDTGIKKPIEVYEYIDCTVLILISFSNSSIRHVNIKEEKIAWAVNVWGAPRFQKRPT